jgi:formylmethanofuran dehydrogenase subunit D
MKVMMNTGRTIPQGESVERKHSPEYESAASVCFIHPVDMMVLGIEDGAHIRLSGSGGIVVLTAVASETVEQGSVFVPLGPFSNHIVSGETHCTGMPDFKSTVVEIIPTEDPVPSVAELMESLGGVRYAH